MTWRALGTTADWYGLTATGSEVFLYRFVAKGISLESSRDALVFARAVGQHNVYNLNVRGVTVTSLGDGTYTIEIVLMTEGPGTYVTYPQNVFKNSEDLAKAIANDRDVSAKFPNGSLHQYQFLQITNPPPALDFWRSHYLLWDRSLGSGGAGTVKFGEGAGVYLGSADSAPNIKPWLASDLPLDTTKPKEPGLLAKVRTEDVIWIGGAALAVWLGYRYVERKKPQARKRAA